MNNTKEYRTGKKAGKEDKANGIRLYAFYQFNEGIGYIQDAFSRGYRDGNA